MSNNQTTVKSQQQPTKNSYFQEGISYLTRGLEFCTQQMQACSPELESDRQKIVDLADQMKAKINFFSSSHTKRKKNQLDGLSNPPLSEDQQIIKQGIAKYKQLESVLKHQTRRYQRVVKVNRRLKRNFWRLKTSLRRLKNMIGVRVEASASKLENKLKSFYKSLKSDLERGRRKMARSAQSAQQDYQASIDSLVSRLRTCVDNTETIKQQSDDLSTQIGRNSTDLSAQIEDLSTDLSTQIGEVSTNLSTQIRRNSTGLSTLIGNISTDLAEKVEAMPYQVNEALRLPQAFENHRDTITYIHRSEYKPESSQRSSSKLCESWATELKRVFEIFDRESN